MSPPPTKSFGGGPPPPPMPSLVLPVVQERSALLRSIEKGTKLKKTITNDKSAPLIGNSRSTNGSNDFKGPVTTKSSPVHTNRSPNGGCPILNINEILAAGRPKLKPVGRQFVNESSKSEKEKTGANACENRADNSNSSSGAISSGNCSDFNKRQIVCDNNKNNLSDVSDLSSQQLKFSTVSAKQTKSADVLETRVKSADSQKGLSVNVPNHGKPNIAPKPPTLSLRLSSSSSSSSSPTMAANSAVTRAQSMRVPRSPTAASVVNNFPNGTVRGFPSGGSSLLSAASSSSILSSNPNLRHVASVRHGSTSSTSSSSSNRSIPPPLPTRFGASLSLRPPVEPPPPPPPPSALRNVQSQQQSLATNTTNNNQNNGNSLTGSGSGGCGPPPPPTRLSSIRTDLEAKFAKHFHSIHEFPLPPKFLNLPKKYISRPVPTSTKQQAPLPPTMSHANTNAPPKCLQLTTDSKLPRSSIC